MISIGMKVRNKAEVRVSYNGARPDDVVPPGCIGEVRYKPKDEDPEACFEIGVTWTCPDGTMVGIEVHEDEVEKLFSLSDFFVLLDDLDPSVSLDLHNLPVVHTVGNQYNETAVRRESFRAWLTNPAALLLTCTEWDERLAAWAAQDEGAQCTIADRMAGVGGDSRINAMRRMLHYSWREIGYDYNKLSADEKRLISSKDFEETRNWLYPSVRQRVRARTEITESGSLGDPNAERLAPGWIHALPGDVGQVVSVNRDGIPTIRFDRTGTATIVDPVEVEW